MREPETSGLALKAHQQGPDPLPDWPRSVGALLARARAQAPDDEFLLFPESQTRFTFRELDEATGALALALNATGLAPGERVALVMRNSEAFVWLFFAVLANRAILVPINPELSATEIGYVLRDSGATLLFFDAPLMTKLGAALESCASKPVAHAIGALGDLWRALPTPERAAPLPTPEHTDTAAILYTSGTTGKPKGVVLTHLNFVADASAIAEWFGFDRSVRTLCMLPLFHNNGQVVTLLTPLVVGGSTVIIDPRSSLRSFWGLAATHGVTWTSVMPSMLAAFLASARSVPAHRVAGIICGGQVLGRELQARFEQTFGVPVFEGFGLTETTSFACFNAHPAERRRPGSVGRALPINAMRIVDEHDREVGAGVEGEIVVRGYNVASEYHGLPAASAARFREGWFHTGDYGVRDNEGHFYFRGRRDDLIIKGGENIYPAELENVLFLHAGVAEVAVVGIPDDTLGQDLCAFVKLKPGATTGAADLQAFCVGRIAAFKQPQRVIVIDHLADLHEIPKGPTKKVLYRELLRYYNEHLAR